MGVTVVVRLIEISVVWRNQDNIMHMLVKKTYFIKKVMIMEILLTFIKLTIDLKLRKIKIVQFHRRNVHSYNKQSTCISLSLSPADTVNLSSMMLSQEGAQRLRLVLQSVPCEHLQKLQDQVFWHVHNEHPVFG